MRSGFWFIAVAASLGVLTSPARAQRRGRGGVMVGASLLRASAFSLTETRSDGGVARQATIAASTGLAFHVSLVALPWLAPFASELVTLDAGSGWPSGWEAADTVWTAGPSTGALRAIARARRLEGIGCLDQ
jgi:hypothetical protein